MRRGGTWLALAGAVLALAACGGDGDDASIQEPRLPRAVAERLARESDAVADKLDAGDVCGAAQQADLLVETVEQAIADGDVPDEFQAELTATAQELQNDVNCPQPEPPPPPADDCKELEEEKKALEGQKQGLEGEEAEALDQQIKELDERLKECKNGKGKGNGGNGNGEGDE